MITSDHFFEFACREDYSFNRNRYFELLEKSNKRYGYLISSLYHPYIIPEDEFKELKSQAEKLALLLSRVAEIYIKEAAVAAFYKFSDELNEWISIDPGYSMSVPISRYDGFWDGRTYRFCEFNTDGTSGLNDIRILDDSFLSTPMGKEFSEKYNLMRFDLPKSILEVLIATYREFGGKGIPNIAITDYKEKSTSDEFLYLRDYFISQGYPTEICDIRNFTLQSDGLWHNNFKVDLIYRRAVTDDIISYAADSKVFLEAYRKRAVCVVGPLRSHVIHNKQTFPFLNSTIAEKYFSSEDLSFIRERIPWTRRLSDSQSSDRQVSDSSINLKEIIENKNDYFLKPHDSYAANGVVCGSDVTAEEWERSINSILQSDDAKRYLVQKKIEIPTRFFAVDNIPSFRKFNVKLDPYLFGTKFCGFYTRISTKNIIALNLQGMLLPCFVSGA
ncbi:MAG TPA: hypothetical protein DD381_01770 [Lentisphaeria bacterium]|nr:MAG: hypothetical protein A2X47_10260 [Lentisphaerae bacterium GWF2_38_69]HBM15070.1 hypothetical protein [Lentisphaeria bacterium]